ncbi:hypothetical protein SAMN03080617_00396 [Algoriphagus alkaliphilus]|uniref:Uncharacterized protein n=1 Tax=Algoriphagus alkaliphilus TaxID=279824 RepID=A0A1G5VAH6_9BACT|nr:hypothetical protein [Algoriphagus alkaliphilus]MBA4302234.1 hypothetical protein [Cyclobacterium sp.]SDA42883.1 hypothetical protein SAMN03080617_00396 [Algoriphagus alkaliphilus]
MKNEEIRNAAYQLAGLIYGIALDGIITKNEYEAMKSWCYENEPLCEMDSFQRLHSQIKPIIEDGKVNKEEIEALKNILNSFLEETGSINDKEPNLYFLNGIFKGILASGDVNTYEIYKLNQWLEKNEHLRKSTPFDELFSLIASVLEDKKVDDEEAVKLKAFFSAHL